MRKEIIVFLVMELGFVACSGDPSTVGEPVGRIPQSQRQETREPLTASGEQELRTIVQSGRLSDLQWPNFSNHGASVKEFYEENGFKGMEPEWQADGSGIGFHSYSRAGRCQGSRQQGLRRGAMGGSREDVIQSGDGAAESGRVRFDVALTDRELGTFPTCTSERWTRRVCTRISIPNASIMMPGPFFRNMCSGRTGLLS